MGLIWSVLKICFFVALIAAITYGAGFIMDAGGAVTIQFMGREISITPIQAIIAIVLLITSVWILDWLLGLTMAVFRFFNGDETALSRYFGRNRERRGYEALTDGLVALAAGEGKTAVAKVAQAERYLDRPGLTNLISAQAAESAGDTTRALRYYKNLLTDERTRFVGVQGIMKQKLADGDTDTALKLAEKAFALRPSHNPTMDTLFALQTEKEEWQGAQKTIEAKVRSNHLPRDVGKRREAVLALADARQLLDAGDIEAGKAAALRANKLAPGLVPAAVLTAEMQMLSDNARAASSALKKAWSANPHPDLAASFAEIDPQETPTARLKRFAALTRVNADHPETKLLRGELALADEDFPAARRAVRELAETDPTTRSLSIMAAIEKGEGADDKTVRAWLAKALNAPRGDQWVCESCKQIHGSWSPSCPNCGGFDTIEWTRPLNVAQEETATIGFTAGILTGSTSKEESAEPVSDLEAEDQSIQDAELLGEDEVVEKP